MNLYEILRNDFIKSRLEKSILTKKALESVIAEIINKQKTSVNVVITEDVAIACIEKQIKILEEIINFSISRENRQEEVAQAKEQIKILQQYLPKQLNEIEVKAMIVEVVALLESPKRDGKTKGLIMKEVLPMIVGKFDKSKINQMVDDILLKMVK